MFGFVLVAAATLMQAYVFLRAATVPWVRQIIPLKVLLGAGLLLWALLVLGRYVGHSSSGLAAAILENAGFTWLGFVFITFAVLLPVDLLTGFGLFFRTAAPALRGLALVAGGALSVVAIIQGLRPPVVIEHEVVLDGLPPSLDKTVLVALSDTHSGSVLGEAWMKARLAQVEALHPDLIVLLGDLFEGHGPGEDRLAELVASLEAPLGVYAVSGNHDRFRGAGSGLALLGERGVQVLNGRWTEARPGLVIAGVEDLGRVGDEDLESRILPALEGRPPGATILLSHTPAGAEIAAREGVGLLLSGHTHGGQIWPFGYLVRLRYPLFAGRYEKGGMTVLVSRGAGTWGPRMRLWRPGDILKVTLRAPEAPSSTKELQ